jgi:putative restriction endonuclease
LNPEELKKKIKAQKPWARESERTPYKPLLLLYALGQLQSGHETLSYEEHEENLKRLFIEFGPNRKLTMANPFTS